MLTEEAGLGCSLFCVDVFFGPMTSKQCFPAISTNHINASVRESSRPLTSATNENAALAFEAHETNPANYQTLGCHQRSSSVVKCLTSSTLDNLACNIAAITYDHLVKAPLECPMNSTAD